MKKFACTLLFVPVSLLCDTVHLKDGRQISGKTIQNNPSFITIESANGKQSFKKKDIKKVIYHTNHNIDSPSLNNHSANKYNPVKKVLLPLTPDLTQEDEDFIFKESGLYKIESHHFLTRHRTYPGRLDDTNQFIKDLYSLESSIPMQNLRAEFSVLMDDVDFIDIGPALSNPQYTATTAISIVKDFPLLKVSLIDLSEAVDFFYTDKIDQRVRDELKSCSILKGDGLKTVAIIKEPNKAAFVRAANSIDVYASREEAKIFLESFFKWKVPVILFFNRAILLKKENENSWKLIGRLSTRGFHHNTQSLARGSRYAYQLLKD